MVRKHDDKADAAPPLSDQQVADYLRRHPDFLLRHTELAAFLAPPSRWPGSEAVVDLQTFMIERLQEEVDRVRGAAEHLIHTSRSNMSTQNRTHQAVLALLSADSMAELAGAVADDLAPMLDVDVATLAFEESGEALPELAAAAILRLPPGHVDRVLGGPDRACALAEQMPGDPLVFGEGADLVSSSALVRLDAGGRCPAGLLALGSRHGRTFHSGQGTELIAFLAQVAALSVRRFVG
ncbi:DUF484 family protein [Magnetospirillum moscoviense]|uniref:DUF484 domain-containing protein n=1 Tax=Magnetospirillum moscoviense TaxID=1437059 RepID=A0A178MUX3_9PROT|nr:DUF484 family protein [Magnetospirillum moscoviense]OAN54007.1 hypothetical protein A6A05_09350 [Magnetospirillum moscoviense]